MKKLYLHLSIILLAVFCTQSVSSAAVDLKLNLSQGEVYRVRSENYVRMVQSMLGIEMEMSQRIVIYYTFKVLDTDPSADTYTFEVKHEAVSVELDGVGGDLRWDSNQGENPEHPLAKGLDALAGESYTLELSSKGKVLGVTGLDKITAKIASSAGLPEGDSNETVLGGLRGVASEQAQTELLEQLFGVYPDNSVDPGDSWIVSNTSNVIPLKQEGTLTLREIIGGQAVIGIEAALSTSGESVKRAMGPLELEMELEGAQTGTFRVDLESGWITQKDTRIDINGTYSVVDGGKFLEGKKMPITIESVFSWEPF